MSDANLTRILIAREGVTGTIPPPETKYQSVRFSQTTLRPRKQVSRSRTLTGDRSIEDVVNLGWHSSGRVTSEFAVGAHNEFILAALQQGQFFADTFSLTGDIDATTGTLTVTAGMVPPDAQGAKYMKIIGTAPGNTGIKRVISATLHEIVFEGMAQDETGAGITIRWCYARNANTFFTFAIEKQLLNTSPACFQLYRGQAVDKWHLELNAREILENTFEFLGIGMENDAEAFGDGEPEAIPATKICTGEHVNKVYWNDSDIAAAVYQISFTLDNLLRQRSRCASTYDLEQGSGTGMASGSIRTYFETDEMLQDYLAHATRSLLVPIVDADGNLCSIFLPSTKSSNSSVPIAGENTDLIQTYDYIAQRGPDGYFIQIDYLLGAEEVAPDHAFEDFESYTVGVSLNGLNGGIHWLGPWVGGHFYLGLQAIDDFEQTSGTQLGGTNGGETWAGPWVDGVFSLGIQFHMPFTDNTVGDLNNQAGGNGPSAGPWVDGNFYTGIKATDNFEAGVDGGSLNGLNGGDGWLGPWVD